MDRKTQASLLEGVRTDAGCCAGGDDGLGGRCEMSGSCHRMEISGKLYRVEKDGRAKERVLTTRPWQRAHSWIRLSVLDDAVSCSREEEEEEEDVD